MGTKNIIIIIIIIPNIRWWKQEKINKIQQLHTTTPSPFKNTKPILLSYVLFKRASPILWHSCYTSFHIEML